MSPTTTNPATQAPTALTRAEFADAQGWSRPYVTKLGKEGRLVETEDGKVLVAESLAKIAATARGRSSAQGGGVDLEQPAGTHRQRKDFYDAENARLDLEERVGNLLPRGEVINVTANIATFLRQRLSSRSAMLAPALAAADGNEARIKTLLSEYDDATLAEISRLFATLGGEAS